jgi:hypothetical protein
MWPRLILMDLPFPGGCLVTVVPISSARICALNQRVPLRQQAFLDASLTDNARQSSCILQSLHSITVLDNYGGAVHWCSRNIGCFWLHYLGNSKICPLSIWGGRRTTLGSGHRGTLWICD